MYQHPASRGPRYGVFAYGAASYAVFLATFVYLIDFIGDLWVPEARDSAPRLALVPALGIDVALLALFAVQHSAIARPALKRWWTTVIPPAAERSTYVLASSAALALLMAGWQPLGGEIWRIEQPLLQMLVWGVFTAGWALILVATIGRFRVALPLIVLAWFSTVQPRACVGKSARVPDGLVQATLKAARDAPAAGRAARSGSPRHLAPP